MIQSFLINTLIIYAGSLMLQGVKIKSVITALAAAFLLGVVNLLIKPILLFLSMPLIILTLGLFIPILNAWILMLISNMIDGFEIRSFWWALIYGIFISITNSFIHFIF
ncbi:MAG: phage holin family protein [Balneolaceae bacterium]|nr:phage holin family protein [Balneolaceae bacterium]MCH8548376.1 phage holin family protein [Balneolaceae bacterium]